jgi:hypothetical protein
LSFVGTFAEEFKMSPLLTDADIDCVARGLIDRSLPKSAWTHAAHFASALWLLKRRGLHAMGEMGPLIMAYNEATGVANTDTGGYHETITVASLRAAHSWLLSRPEAPLHAILAEMLASPIGRSDWVLTYWSRPLLFSVAARKSWVEPDLAALPY